ncbi:MAG: XRE family transcriptional regulator [Phycisphaerae bacterium]|nr:XRE family transcriptional regulator [Phycisphaerae bacterium]
MSIPERLKYARSRAGLTGHQVQDRTGVGNSSLSEFEAGKREPSLSQLQKLASVYRRSVSFFLAEGAILEEEMVLWREKPEAEAANQELRFLQLCRQYHNLEIWTNEKTSVCLPVENKNSGNYSYSDAEALAEETRGLLELGKCPGLSLLPVLEEACDVKIFHLDMKPTGTAASAKSEAFGAAVLLNSGSVRWRRNFDLAHELFHLLTWEIFPTPVDGETKPQDKIEKLANCFASNLLMPPKAMRTAVNSKIENGGLVIEDLFDIARQFDVSVEALIWRMHRLQRLSGNKKKTEALINRAKELAPLLEERKYSKPLTLPERYKALAVKALKYGEISIGRFAEYLDISRQKAMKYVEQEIVDDEKISIASA